MREERVDAGGVPARLYEPSGATGLLLLGHGGGHSKDATRFVELSRRYARETGLAVLCIDTVGHGERRLAGATPGIPRQWHSSSVPRMVEDWRVAAGAVSSIGPPVVYVGFSMGAIFGVPTVAALASIRAAVFVVGGVPVGAGIDDPALGALLAADAGRLHHADVLMLNKRNDEVIPLASARDLFAAVRARDKEMALWDGGHDEWPEEMVARSVTFVVEHLR